MGWELVFYALISMAVSYAITASMAPSPPSNDPASMSEVEFPQTDEGTPQAVVFGDVWISNWTILALGNFRTTPIIKPTGGKK
nr:MAG TPA: hypothetical protein [Caudoviricetes sp.]